MNSFPRLITTSGYYSFKGCRKVIARVGMQSATNQRGMRTPLHAAGRSPHEPLISFSHPHGRGNQPAHHPPGSSLLPGITYLVSRALLPKPEPVEGRPGSRCRRSRRSDRYSVRISSACSLAGSTSAKELARSIQILSYAIRRRAVTRGRCFHSFSRSMGGVLAFRRSKGRCSQSARRQCTA